MRPLVALAGVLILAPLTMRAISDTRLFAVFVLGFAGLVLAAYLDKWAGFFLTYSALLTLGTPSEQRGLIAVQLLGMGLFIYASIRFLNPTRLVYWVLVGLALAESLSAIGQQFSLDPLAGAYPYVLDRRSVGIAGHPDWSGSVIALGGSLAPVWALPLIAGGLYSTQHRLGILAIVCALLWRYRRYRWLGFGVLALAGVLVTLKLSVWHFRDLLGSADQLYSRLEAFSIGLRLWAFNSWFFGLGPNGWGTYAAGVQQADGARSDFLLFAHNEPLQVLVDTGLCGLAFLGLWLRSTRRIWTTSWTPALLALLILSMGMFPFRIPGLAVLGIALIAVAIEDGEIWEKESVQCSV